LNLTNQTGQLSLAIRPWGAATSISMMTLLVFFIALHYISFFLVLHCFVVQCIIVYSAF